ncbi:MAG: nucleoside 2-deoxyribosyltransferase [Halobacteriovoraceae bacterium]|nr:nucleoside 2-deoxyribosyltransferase [Halobacteriovoraceae bacterium]
MDSCLFKKEIDFYKAKAYLAGPDVFRADAIEYGNKLKNICIQNGIKGLYPLDNEINLKRNVNHRDIFLSNIKMITECDFVIANISPFRGYSVDATTAYEVGVAFAMGKPVFAYSSDRTSLVNRVKRSPYLIDSDYPVIESFNLIDSLMLVNSIESISSSFEEALFRAMNTGAIYGED